MHNKQKAWPKLPTLLIISALTLTQSISAQSSATDELGAWYIYNGFFGLNERFEIFFETQARNYEVFGNQEAFYLRPYLTYNIHPDFQVGLSTEYHKHSSFETDQNPKESQEEIRIGTQAILSHRISNVRLQHRYRYEFRNIESVLKQRMRYRFQMTIPLFLSNETEERFFINSNIELFVHSQPEWSFDQSRMFAALGYHINKNLHFQLGYMRVGKAKGSYNRLQFFLTSIL